MGRCCPSRCAALPILAPSQIDPEARPHRHGPAGYHVGVTAVLPKSWETWYRFALEELEVEHDEAVEYANTRYVEEQNRARLRGDRPEPVPPAPKTR